MYWVYILALASFWLPSYANPILKRSVNGPVITANFPDPAIIQVGSIYYAFATGNGVYNVQIATSPDFSTWTVLRKDALPTVGAWSNGANVWAHDVIQVGSQFVLYYAATTSDGSTHCIGAATSSSVEGPYSASAHTIACPKSQGGAIDPAGFSDNGALYVLYKIDGNSIGHGGNCNNGVSPIVSTPIMLQRMESTGVKPTSASPVQLITNGPADGPLVEAPSLVNVAGTYILFFSSNCYSGQYYDVSYATASSVAGPYTKASAPNAPLLQTGSENGVLYSPGGADVLVDGSRIVFHADLGTNANTRQMWTGAIKVSGTVVSI